MAKKKKSISRRNGNGNFEIQLFERRIKKVRGKKKTTFVKVSFSKFQRRRFYKLFTVHKPSGQKRLFAMGKFRSLPIFSQQEQKKGFLLGGRKFKPLAIPKKGKGNWVTRTQLISQFDKELRTQAKKLKVQSAAVFIPTKRFFHKKWLVYSDKFRKGEERVKSVLAHVVVRFDYPLRSWVNKQFIDIDFARPIFLRNLHKHLKKFDDLLDLRLTALHPGADSVSVISVNGFIPK